MCNTPVPPIPISPACLEELKKWLCGTTPPIPPIPIKDFGGLRPHLQGFGSGATQSQPIVNSNIGGRGGNIYIVDSLEDKREEPKLQEVIRKQHQRLTDVPDTRAHMGEFGTQTKTVKLAAKPDTKIFKTTLRSALEANEPRYIVSEVGGQVTLDSNLGALRMVNPYCTMGLQTAPSPGINIIGQVWINTHDVFLQHFRIRFPKIGNIGSADTIPLLIGGPDVDTYNIAKDHLSIAFANQYMSVASADTSGTRPNPWDINMSDLLIAWPLSANDVMYQGYGAAWWTVNNGQVSSLRNLYVHSSHRNINGGAMRLQHVDNAVYGSGPDNSWLVLSVQAPGGWFPDGGPGYVTQALFEGNGFFPSYGTGSNSNNTKGTDLDHRSMNMQFNKQNVYQRGDRIWLKDNAGPFITGPDPDGQLAGVYWQEDTFTKDEIFNNGPFPWHVQMDIQRIQSNFVKRISDNAGARPKDRDATDLLAIQCFKAGIILDTPNMGSRITSPDELGIDTSIPPSFKALELPDDPNMVVDEFGRTRMDVWLNNKALELEV